jgi:hypothetical protein
MTIARFRAQELFGYGPASALNTDAHGIEVVTYADHCRAVAEVWQEAHDLLAREGWDMSREKLLEYFAEQAEEAAPQKERETHVVDEDWQPNSDSPRWHPPQAKEGRDE